MTIDWCTDAVQRIDDDFVLLDPVVVAELRGHQRTAAAAYDAGLERLAADLAALPDRLTHWQRVRFFLGDCIYRLADHLRRYPV